MAIRLVVHGPSTALSPPARAFVFDQPRISLGRAASSDVPLPHATVSAAHASIAAEGAGYLLTDEGSTNGTRVDGLKIPPMRPKRLESGAVLQLGAFAVKVEILAGTTEVTDAKTAARAARALLLGALAAEGRLPRAAHLTVGDPPREISLEGLASPITLGRDPSARIHLDAPSVSRRHAELVLDGDAFVLVDVGGSGGVSVGERAITRRRLRSGDTLTIGGVELRFVDPAEDALAEVRAAPDEAADPPLPATDGERVEAEAPPDEAPGAIDDGGDEAPRLLPAWEPRRSERRRGEGAGAGTSDAVVFMLAGAMIALSAVGLYLLFGDF